MSNNIEAILDKLSSVIVKLEAQFNDAKESGESLDGIEYGILGDEVDNTTCWGY